MDDHVKKEPKRQRFKKMKTAALAVYNAFLLAMIPSAISPLAAAAGFHIPNPYGPTIYELVTGRKVGPDNRTQVSDFVRINSPIIRIKVLNDQVWSHCTGAAIAPTVFVTAAHCLDGDVKEIILDRGGEYVYNSIPTNTDFAKTTKFAIHDQYNGSENDIGLIFTDHQAVNRWFEIDEFPKEEATSLKLQTAGFPVDKPEGTMWKAEYSGFQTGRFDNFLSSAGVSYGGQSGSPFYQPFGKNSHPIVGKVYGVLKGSSESGNTNNQQVTTLTEFDKDDLDWIKKKIKENENSRT